MCSLKKKKNKKNKSGCLLVMILSQPKLIRYPEESLPGMNSTEGLGSKLCREKKKIMWRVNPQNCELPPVNNNLLSKCISEPEGHSNN